MSVFELLATLKAKDIQLAVTDDQLRVQGNKQALSDPAILALLREHKPALIELIKAGDYSASKNGQVSVPDNGVVPGTTRITPAMLTLVELDQPTIDRLVSEVPGGAANVQDIYPLAPLQEGILYHHVSGGEGDPYIMQSQFAFASLERLHAFAEALQSVIDRHDILRTGVVWEGLDQPLQVVWRQADLPLEEVVPQADGDVLAQLHERFDARHFRMDVSRAPLMRLAYAVDQAGQRVVATLLFHHMALDHSALDVVRHEMRACLLGQSAALGRPVPFRNYVAQARLGVSEAEHEAFFREMLGDIHEPTLPFGLQDVQGDGQGIAELSMPIDAHLGQRLRGQARQLGVSAASLFHLGWAQVLATITGKQSVVFGTVLMGRMQGAEATDRALGIFINTLPLRVDIDAQDVRAAVHATHARLTTVMRHEHAPLALAQRCSNVVSPTPLFSSLLNYRHSHTAASASAETMAAWAGISTLHSEERTNYPLTLSADDLGDAFSLTLLASTQIDPQRVCAYMHCALESLVFALEQAPDTPINQLSILPATEREQVLVGFNATAADYPRGLTIAQRFEAQVSERPEAVAAVFLGEQLTYAELNLHANALAHHLIDLGVQPDDRVAIVARRGLDTLVGLVAILKAGAGYVPVDPAHPAERLHYLLSDSAPVAVLTQNDLRERLPALAVPVIDLDRCTWPLNSPLDPKVPGLTAEHLAYVIYTSGSTGLPKGVMVEHQTLSNLVDWHCNAFDLCAGRHTSSLAGFGFDAMAWEVWPALCAGATLHLAPTQDGGEDIDALLQWWRAQPLDVSFLPTPVAEYAFNQNLEHPTLRTLLIGGDRLRQFTRNQHFDVINNYGPTEATVVATSGKIEAGQTLHIGQPVSNATVYLLDAQQRPVPIGVAGELYVGGAGVARGYLNRPELTAERFLDDPFNRGRMYRTGDLARWCADGTLEYIGRNDDQVKIRGVRIELGEIETRLNQLPGIQEAVLLAREDQPGQVRLVAYFTEQPQVEPLALGELRAHLLTQLPEYMVPTAFVRLDALPLTANGKVDRKALPKPEHSALFSREYAAPQGELEIALAQIWADVLQVERVGRQDHFFELGGHSLLAMRMVSQVRQRLGVELALSDLFANAELAAVAEVLTRAGRSTQPEILPVPRDGALPLSFAQQRLWLLAQMEGANTAYNIPIALRLRGRLDDDALQRALARIVARHETLRSRFAQFNDAAQVLIAPVDSGLLLRVEDLREHPQADEVLQALIEGEASGPFDLQDDPLIRGRLVRLADDHHVLLLTVHHIIADGWSMGVLTRELMALYQAFSHGAADPLPPLSLQYTDYAVWQRRWLSGEVLQRQSEYWQQTLAGAPAVLLLPTDRPRPAQQEFAGSTVEVLLDERLTAGLKALCQRHGVTLYMALISAWAVLLSRLSGQSDVVIGSPVANRSRAEIEGLIGMFVNTLALRIDTSGELSVEALLARVKALTLEAQAHQDLPFEQVVEITRPPRSLAHSPLFQTMFSWDSGNGSGLTLGDLTLEGVAEPSHFAKFDLSLTLGETQGEIRGVLEFATALFDEATAVRFVSYFQRLVQAMVGNDQALLAQVEILAQDERQRLLVDFNASAVDLDLQQTVHGLFELQVLRTPDAVALVAGEQMLTYAELNQQANRLAQHLIEQGVGPDSRVAICVERSLDLLVGLLAILKAGGAYVPLDPVYPPERLAYMLEDSAPVAVLVHAATRSLLGATATTLIDLDRCTWQNQSERNPQVPGLTAENLAYVIYTSGSTGTPKGVMVEHRSVANLLHWSAQLCPTAEGAALLQKTPFSFDASVWELFWPLTAGLRLVLASPDAHRDPAELARVIQQQQITVIQFVPALLQQFLELEEVSQCRSLADIVCGGGELSAALVRSVRERLPHVRLHNVYGPTEATVDSSVWTLEPNSPLADTPPIGKPICNTRVYILDAWQQPVPQGVVGELYIGGEQVARGYLNRPELTAERFLKDPFSADARMYRTGDLGRYLADGNIQYLGRNDDQVKIHGLRIELGEIQARLSLIEGVQDCVVLAREDVPGDQRLVAYYVGTKLHVDVLRADLLKHLPDYMLPALFVHLDALPLSPNGKIDRKALPAPDQSALSTREYAAPVGEVEIAIAGLWEELLKVERVGRHDHFFELGGHSLLAVNLVARMRRAGLSADIRVLFGQPTLAALAAAVGGAPEVAVPANLIPEGCTQITPELLPLVALDQPAIERIVASIPGGAANVQDIYPLAPLQAGILFHHLSATEGDSYVLQAQFAFADEQRLHAFTQSLQEVINRHDVLRTSLFWEGLEEPVQVVWRNAALACEAQTIDATGADAMAQLRRRFDAAHYRMPVTQAPLMRVVHAPDPANQRVVALLLFHHLVMDHVALEVLRHEMQAVLLGQAQRLAEPVPYRNYVARTRSGLSEQEHQSFFREMLGDVDEPTLPYGHNPAQEGLAQQAHLALENPLSRRIRAQSRRLGISAASLMHLAWAQVLGQLSGRNDVVFGTVLLGRLQGGEGAERAMGVFINTLPLRIDLAAHSAKGAALETHQRLSQLLQHEHAQLALVQHCSAMAPGTPLFSSLLNYRHSSAVGAVSDEVQTAWRGMQLLQAEEYSNYRLTLSVDDLGEGFSLTALAGAGIDAARVCAYMQRALAELLEALEHSPQLGLDRLSIVPAAEREQVLVGFNATAADYPRGLTIGQRFEAQVAARPEALAAVFAGTQLTYAELNRKANALAHHLINLGVQPDDRVAIVARRGLETLVGMLATLKAGAGYVPVDPAHPAERLHYLLSDSAPVAVLTQTSLLERLPALEVPVIELDTRTWPNAATHNPSVPGLTAAHLAYVIYTSGSTGLPKGVMVEHQTLSNLIDWHCAAFDLGAGRHTSSLAGFGFDATAWEIWPALCSGATLHLAPTHDGNEDIDALLEWWRGQPLDVSFLPTPVAEYAFSQNLEHPTLRTLLIGGDRLRQFSRNQHYDVINNYGPTEATVVATSGKIAAGQTLHIGLPVSNATVYLLDVQQRPVPIGVAGELYVGGAGVARGYLNRPELTAERFLDDPFNSGRMYRTGDLARWRADGTLEYLGRNDDQVKIRGVRIELGEIETRLSQLPGIKEALLLAREDQPGQPRLVAYFTEQAQIEPLTASDLRTQLLAQLPEYMVPAAFVKLDNFPLTANGKVDRKALPLPERAALFSREYAAPLGAVETTVAQIWAEVLQVEQVGRHDHFFELGGHSLLAMRMVSQVRQQLGVELPLSELFANPELAAVAEVLTRAGRSTLPDILPAARDHALPLSFAQQRLWFLAQMEGGNAAYNIALGLRLRGRLDEAALQQALARIVARHETLRSRFICVNDEVQVQIAPVDSVFQLPINDLRGDPNTRELMQKLLEDEASAPFDLHNDWLIRGRLVRLVDDHHVLLLTVHHIIADGWSMGVLTHELMALYAAFSRGEPDPLPPLALQYTDYAVWQRRWLSGAVLQQQSEYWQQTLAGAPTLLALPTDRPRPAQQDYSGAGVEIWLDTELSAGLKALSQRHGVTLYMTLMSAWAMLMSRLSGQSDVVIGSPVANRSRAEIEGLIGMFVNTLALRIDTSGELSVAALLARVKARALEAQAHQDLPFEQVVEIARPARSLAHSPLFQTSLSWNSASGSELTLADLSLEALGGQVHVAKFDLTLTLGEARDRIGGWLEYATALFDETTIKRYVGYFQRLLRAMVSNDLTLLEQVPILEQPERQRLLADFNATAREYPQALTVHLLFESQVLVNPQAIAAVHGAQHLSYFELNAKANRLAHQLIGQGVQPGAHVALLLPRSLELLIAQLAVSKCAAAYVPLDINAPSERQAFMVRDCGAAALLTLSNMAVDYPVKRIDLGTLVLDGQPDYNPDLPQSSESLAYIMYTSGSTGTPKGVMVPHRAIGRLVINNGYADFNPQDRVVFASNPAFDASTMDVWGALLNGAQVVVIEHATLLDPLAFGRELAAKGATILFVTTALFNQYVQLIPEALKGLRILLCGGERGDPAAFRTLLAEAPGLRIVHCYGPTETTTYATTFAVHAVADNADNVPIGGPISNTQVYVLDAQQQPVPQGVTGELYIGGQGVALGYLNRPDLTAEKFLRDPFSDQPDARLYRTGDLARWNAAGQLECIGRNDDQVKIRGFRIELGEIENRLLSCAGVKEAVVLARQDGQEPLRLVAYFTLSDATVQSADLRAQLQARLPEYMVPAAWVRLAVLPLTNNGKVDRKALPIPAQDAVLSRAYAAPVTALEQTLARLWAEVLQVEQVGRHDNFFELGGHSLLAMRMVSQVRQQLGVELALNDLFANAELAAVAEVLSGAARSTLPDILPASRDEVLPLSFAQQRLWFLAQMHGGNTAYNIPIGLRLRGRLDAPALQQALARIVARHETLRSRFTSFNDQAQVLIAPLDSDWLLRIEDLRGQPQAEQTLQSLIETEACAAFNLQDGPLFRGRLVCLSDDHHVLLLTVHHIIADGWSMGVLTRELMALYQALSRGEEDPLPPLALQYTDYAVWQRRWLTGEVLQRQSDYWQKTLAGAPSVLTLPLDRPRPVQHDYSGAGVEIFFDQPLSAALKALSQRHGATLYMTLLSAWAMLLSRLSGQSEVVIGSPVANRNRAEIEGLIGMFVNTLALRIDTSGELSVEALLAQVKARTLEAQSHQDLPFEQVVEITRPVRSLAHSPLFQTMFSWDSSGGPTLALGELTLEGVAAQSHSVKFDLSLSLGEAQDGIRGGLNYATALFDEATIQRFVGYFQRLLRAMSASDQTILEQVDLLGQDERQHLLEDFNATAVDCAIDQPIQMLFEAQVRLKPDAIALQAGEQRLTYRELNEQANRLAHYLREQGVQPDSRVAICVERGLDLVIGLLGILKAGGAYVPLDPDYPLERLHYMLQDSAPVAVLVHAPTRELFGDSGLALIDFDRCTWLEQSDANPHVSGLSASNLAYMIYTSGSTGTPKGVMLEHRGLCNLMHWGSQICPPRPDAALLQKAPFSFDGSVWEFFWPLTAGVRLVLARPGGHREPAYLAQVIREQQISVVKFVPALLQQFLELEDVSQCRSLSDVFCGGGELTAALARAVRQRLPWVRLHNVYGPTEATVDSTAWTLEPQMPVPESELPIGSAICNTRLYVLDAHDRPVPLGVSGQLHIGGVGVARGYLGLPQMQAERFIDSPFVAGDRLYRTGDLVRYRADGNLEFLGRNDFQVKLRGLRLELGEIEARLIEHPAVREAVVLVRDERLVAYFSIRDGDSAPGIEALRAHVLERLPDYMTPGAFVLLDTLPLSPNGKVDRKALPAPDQAAFISREYAAPQGAVESALAQIWAEVLGGEQVGRHDNFFELGGHSLLAIRLVNLMQRAGLQVTLAELFQHPSIESVATLLSRGEAVAEPPEGLVIVRAATTGTPLFLVHEFSGRDVYFPALGMHIAGEFPIYGLPGVPLGQPQLRTLECMAARMVGIMRSVQPQGPYRLAGWSFGGLLAYEIAQQLLGLDQTVAFVGMLDTYAPRPASQNKAQWSGAHLHERLLLQHCQARASLSGVDEQAAVARLEAEMPHMDFAALFAHCCAQQLPDPELAALAPADAWHYFEREAAHGQALAHYRVSPASQPIHLLRADSLMPGQLETSPTRYWGEKISADLLRCIDVPGDHKSMMQAPHIQTLGETLSRALEVASAPAPVTYQPLLTIQTGQTGQAPIFCMPGAGDSVTGFIQLTEALGPEWPIHGLQPRGLDGVSVPHTQVEAAAAFYLRAIEQVYPEGPVHLIGHSFGGWVAHAMAAQLQAAGRPVASLTLIDTEAPDGSEVMGKPHTTTAALQRLIETLQLSCGKSLGIDPQTFADADDSTQMRLLHEGMVRAGVLSPRAVADAMHGPVRTFATALRTLYQPALRYSGPVRLALVDDPKLDAEGNQREQAAMVEGWQRQLGDLAVWYGPGNHFTILKAPNVFSLAAWWHDGLTHKAGEVLS